MNSDNTRIIVNACSFRAYIKEANLTLKFPCQLFVQWKTATGERSVTLNKSQVKNGYAKFNESIDIVIDLLFDENRQKFIKKESLIFLNLISNSKPNDPKMVGRITVDLADVLNSNLFKEVQNHKLSYCSSDAYLSFNIQCIEKIVTDRNPKDIDRDSLNDYFSHHSVKFLDKSVNQSKIRSKQSKSPQKEIIHIRSSVVWKKDDVTDSKQQSLITPSKNDFQKNNESPKGFEWGRYGSPQQGKKIQKIQISPINSVKNSIPKDYPRVQRKTTSISNKQDKSIIPEKMKFNEVKIEQKYVSEIIEPQKLTKDLENLKNEYNLQISQLANKINSSNNIIKQLEMQNLQLKDKYNLQKANHINQLQNNIEKHNRQLGQLQFVQRQSQTKIFNYQSEIKNLQKQINDLKQQQKHQLQQINLDNQELGKRLQEEMELRLKLEEEISINKIVLDQTKQTPQKYINIQLKNQLVIAKQSLQQYSRQIQSLNKIIEELNKSKTDNKQSEYQSIIQELRQQIRLISQRRLQAQNGCVIRDEQLQDAAQQYINEIEQIKVGKQNLVWANQQLQQQLNMMKKINFEATIQNNKQIQEHILQSNQMNRLLNLTKEELLILEQQKKKIQLRLQQLQTERQKDKTEINNLNQQLTHIKITNKENLQKIKEKTKLITKIQIERDGLLEQLEHIKPIYGQLNASHQINKAKVQEQAKQITNLKTQKLMLEDQIKRIKQHFGIVNQQTQFTKKQLKDQRQQIEKLINQKQHILSELTYFKNHLQQKIKQISQIQQILKDVKIQKENKQNQNKQILEDYERFKALHIQIIFEKQNINKQLQSLRQQFKNINQSHQELKVELNTIRVLKEKSQAQVQKLNLLTQISQGQYQQLNQQNMALISSVKKLNQQKQYYINKIKENDYNKQKIDEDLTNVRKELQLSLQNINFKNQAYQNLSKDYSILEKQIEIINNENQRLISEIQKLQKQRQMMQQEKVQSSNQAKINISLIQKNEGLQSEKKDLLKIIKQYQQANAKVQESLLYLQSQIGDLNTKLQQEISKNQELQQKIIKYAEREIKTKNNVNILEEQSRKIFQLMQVKQENEQLLHQQLSEKQTQLENYRNNEIIYNEKIRNIQNKLNELNLEKENLQETLKTLEDENSQKYKEISSLMYDNSLKQQTIDNYVRKIVQFGSMDQHLEHLEQIKNQKDQQISKLKEEHLAQIKNIEQMLSNNFNAKEIILYNKINDLQAKNLSLDIALKQSEQKLYKNESSFKQQTANLQNEISAEKQQQKIKLQAKFSVLQSQLNAKNVQISNLQQQISNLKIQNNIIRLELQKKVQEYKNLAQVQKVQDKDIVPKKQQPQNIDSSLLIVINTLKAEIQTKTNTINSLDQSMRQLQELNFEYVKKLQNAQIQLSLTQEKVDNFEIQLNYLKQNMKNIEELEQSVFELNCQKMQIQQELKMVLISKKQLQLQLMVKNNQNVEADNQYEFNNLIKLQSQLSEVQNHLYQLQNRNQQLLNEIESLEEELFCRNSNINQKQAIIDELKIQNNSLKAILDNFKTQITSYQSIIQENNHCIKQLTKQLDTKMPNKQTYQSNQDNILIKNTFNVQLNSACELINSLLQTRVKRLKIEQTLAKSINQKKLLEQQLQNSTEQRGLIQQKTRTISMQFQKLKSFIIKLKIAKEDKFNILSMMKPSEQVVNEIVKLSEVLADVKFINSQINFDDHI